MINYLDKIVSFGILLGCLLFIFMGEKPVSAQTFLYWHIISFFCLGILYELPELFLSIFSLWKFKTKEKLLQNLRLFQKIIAVRLFLTHVTGTLFGVMTVVTGLCLIHVLAHTLRQGWLFWIIGVAAIFVAKGLAQHNVFIRKLYFLCEDPQNVPQLHHVLHNRWDTFLNWLELPAYIFILLADYYKPYWPLPWAQNLSQLASYLGSELAASTIYFIAVSILAYGLFKLFPPTSK